MKKALFILVAVAFSINTFAQKGLQVGLIGGPTSNWLVNKNDSDDPTVKNKVGGARGFFGATADYHFSEQAGVGLEFVYAMQGSAYDGYNIHVNYFKIPLVLNFNSNPDHVAMFVGKFGPYLGINTAGKVIVDNSIVPTVDIKSQYAQVNAGLILGLGVGFNIAKVVVLSASLRLDGQLNNAEVSSNPNGLTTYGNTNGTRDRTWSLAGGLEIGAKYIIPMGGKPSSHGKSSYHRK